MALERIQKFASITKALLGRDKIYLQGDSYFDSIDDYFEQLDLGGNLVRDKKVISGSVVQALENPVFDSIKDKEEFRKIKNIFTAKGESL